EEDKALPAVLAEGLRLLEDDSLGGGGSRGSGRVALAKLRLVWRGRGFYASGAAETELTADADLAALQALICDAGFSSKLVE
ncbi:MAG: type III-A CRISPR-associated RAMP protein Csm3, partial [Planctomycetota bacterium]